MSCRKNRGTVALVRQNMIVLVRKQKDPDLVDPKRCAGSEKNLPDPRRRPAYEREDLEESFDGGEVLGVHRLLESARHNAAHLSKDDELFYTRVPMPRI
jgi:hypothetical protein